jgi:hypothetical protein
VCGAEGFTWTCCCVQSCNQPTTLVLVHWRDMGAAVDQVISDMVSCMFACLNQCVCVDLCCCLAGLRRGRQLLLQEGLQWMGRGQLGMGHLCMARRGMEMLTWVMLSSAEACTSLCLNMKASMAFDIAHYAAEKQNSVKPECSAETLNPRQRNNPSTACCVIAAAMEDADSARRAAAEARRQKILARGKDRLATITGTTLPSGKEARELPTMCATNVI